MSAQACNLRSEQIVRRPLAVTVLDVAASSLAHRLFTQWEPDRPELLIRLRPRTEESRVPR